MSPAKKSATKAPMTLESLIAEAPTAVEQPTLERPDGEPFAEPVILELLVAYLCWESSTERAGASAKKLAASVVDVNELRVCLEDELAELFGTQDRFGHERAARLIATLHDVFDKQHKMSLASLQAMPKREARAFLDDLKSIPPYVASRVALRALGAHAVPCDQRLLTLLHRHGIGEDLPDVSVATAWLERQIRASDSAAAHDAFEALVENEPAPKRTNKRGS